MIDHEKVNILLVDDQPAKLLAYEVILKELGENLVVASSGRDALEYLLKNEVAVILVDVCMPELDGFELAAMIRVFAELYRKTRQLERFNAELENRVRARTAELEQSNARLLESEKRRSLAIAAGKMGSWDWDWVNGDWMWDEGQYRIFGVDPRTFVATPASVQELLHPHDVDELRKAIAQFAKGVTSYEAEFRIRRPDGDIRWCVGTAAATVDNGGRVVRVSGVTVDITERKQAEERRI